MNLAIATTISLMGCCVTIPLFMRYGYHLHVSTFMKILFFLGAVGIATLPVFASPEFVERAAPFSRSLQYVLYFIYVTAVILFGLTLCRDIIWTLLALFVDKVPSPFNSQSLTTINTYTFYLSLLCASWALYEGVRVPPVRETIISADGIKKEKTIVVLSDLHLSRSVFVNKIKDLVDKVNTLNPDIIVLPGDTIDDTPHYTRALVQELRRLKARQGVYFTSGNHEFYVGYDSSRQQLMNAGLQFLDNAGVNIDYLCLAGIPDYPTAGKNALPVKWKEACAASNASYRVLLSHTPVSPLQTNADLIISGHTHGGQIFPFHIFSWLYNSRFLSGLYQVRRNKNIYVSRGSGQWGPQMRFLAPAEISVLRLRP